MKFTFTVTIETDTPQHANQVMAERLGHDENYGFDYTILLDWECTSFVPERLTPADAGCIIDGHFGIYIEAMVVEYAQKLGYAVLGEEDGRSLARFLFEKSHPSSPSSHQGDGEAIEWLACDADLWLNEHVAPEGYTFGFHEGEYFMQSDAWWAES